MQEKIKLVAGQMIVPVAWKKELVKKGIHWYSKTSTENPEYILNYFTKSYWNIDSSETIKTPNTWFDAFKFEVLPKWLLKRFPANYTKHKLIIPELPEGFSPAIKKEEIRVGDTIII